MFRTLLHIVIVGWLPLVAGGAEFYDTLYIVDQQQYVAANGNWIGGSGVFGSNNDLQLADDFNTGNFNVLDQVTMDYLTFGVASATQALVEVFPSVGGAPGETPVYSGTFNITGTANFTDTIFGLVGKRYTVNLPNWTLAPNTTYFLAMQPIGTDWGFTPRNGSPTGSDTYGRDGGVDHGNGYQGGYLTNDWRTMGSLGYGAGDVSMRIGWPEPSTLLLAGLAGLMIRGRRA